MSRAARKLNLRTHLFETRLSPLVESRAFAALPEGTRSSLLTSFEQALRDEELAARDTGENSTEGAKDAIGAKDAPVTRRGPDERAAIRARLEAARRRSSGQGAGR